MMSVAQAYSWYTQKKAFAGSENIASHRDIFLARLESFAKQLIKKKVSSGDVGLLSAVAGEIGNNCFDHNLGQWTDSPGALFTYDLFKDHVCLVVADRGQGLFKSLKNVIPSLKTPQEALDVAFFKHVTGRAPEQRGNGLKFVRKTINAKEGRGLFYQSNSAVHQFGSRGMLAQEQLKVQSPKGPDGTFALVWWETK